MVFPRLFRRRRQSRSDSSNHPPAVITIRRDNNGKGRSNRGVSRADSLTNSAEDGIHPDRLGPRYELPSTPQEDEHNQNHDGHGQPANVTVKTQLVMKEDRICGMVEATGNKISSAVELVAIVISALAALSAMTLATIWIAIAGIAWHYLDLPLFMLVLLVCVISMVLIGAISISWVRQYVHRQKKKKPYTSFVTRNSTATWTDVSDLAE